MSEDKTRNGTDADRNDAGQPIDVLDGFEQPTSPTFLKALRAKIERRQLTGNVASLAWHVPWMVIVEFLQLIFDLAGSPSDREGDSK